MVQQQLQKTVWWFLRNLKRELSDTAIPLLGMYVKGLKAGIQEDTCVPVFTNE